MRFANVKFTGNTIHFTDASGAHQEEDFFLMLVRWARAEHGVDFNPELSQIRVEVPAGQTGPVTMTFKEALGHLPKDARRSATMKALNILIPEGTYKYAPRKATAVVRKIGKIHKIRLAKDRPVSDLFETVLNCTLAGDPIPAPPKRRRRASRAA